MDKHARALSRIDNTADERSPRSVEPKQLHEPARDGEELGERGSSPVNKARHVRIVEHQSRSGLVFRPPVEHLRAAPLQLDESTVDTSFDAVEVASVFKDTNDWMAGELVVRHMAVKPWRRTEEGMLAMRVIEGSAWLCMEADEPPAGVDAPSPARGAALAGEPPPAPPAEETPPPGGGGARLEESRMLCAGDWVCLPPRVRYQISGCGLCDDAWLDVPPEDAGPPFRAAFFLRSYGERSGGTRWSNWYEDPHGKPPHDNGADWLGDPPGGGALEPSREAAMGPTGELALDETGRTLSPQERARRAPRGESRKRAAGKAPDDTR